MTWKIPGLGKVFVSTPDRPDRFGGHPVSYSIRTGLFLCR